MVWDNSKKKRIATKFDSFFEILLVLNSNQAVPNYFAEESQTR